MNKPPMKLLVGYDGSVNSDAALEGLKRAGLPWEGELLVLTGADVFLPADGDAPPQPRYASVEKALWVAQTEVTKAGVTAERALESLQRNFPGWTIRHEGCADSPAWALVKKADQWKPDLVVIGAHGHSSLGRFMGSVSQMVVTQAPCSVRVSRVRTDSKLPLKILVGLDGSPGSEATAQAVLSRPWPAGTEFFLISVIDSQMSTLMTRLTPSVIRWFNEQADDHYLVLGRMLETHARKLRDEGHKATCFVREGDPRRVLVEEAERRDIECIFLGARGLSPATRLFLGGVSAAVAARAHCSVEVVRPA